MANHLQRTSFTENVVSLIKAAITRKEKIHALRKDQVEKLARSFEIQDQTEVKELAELAVVHIAREICQGEGTIHQKYLRLLELYNYQPSLTHRSSMSTIYQQYSTPAPIAFLAGVYALGDKKGLSGHRPLSTDEELAALDYAAFEPSAGNGLLTIALDPKNVWVNEIDNFRLQNLQTQNFFKTSNFDSSSLANFHFLQNKMDVVVSNPPFDKLPSAKLFNSTEFEVLDHLMAASALETLKPDGRAAIIIGGHTTYDELGRIKAGKNRKFISYLYKWFNVEDVININGELYRKQGTSFDIRLILINGRKAIPGGFPPLYQDIPPLLRQTASDFTQLYQRVMLHLPEHTPDNNNDTMYNEFELEAEAALALLKLTEKNTELGNAGYMPDLKEFPIAMVATYTNTTSQERYNLERELSAKTGHKAWVDGDGKIHSTEGDIFVYAKPADWKEVKEIIRQVSAKHKHPSVKFFIHDYRTGVSGPYEPVSDSCVVLNTFVPEGMAYETNEALKKMKAAVGGDVTAYVVKKLAYKNKGELCEALAAEQIDAVATAIYNIEHKGQGIIIGDQTGIGKGRQAAAIIRYAIVQGMKPVFISEKPNLFSDMYRDLKAIGAENYRPFIVNGKESKTDVKDEDGNVVYQAPEKPTQEAIIKNPSSKLAPFDYIMATYSQFNKNKVTDEGLMETDAKGNFLFTVSEKNIFILDESHNASGLSNTGLFLNKCVARTRSTIFLSATFAKRPDNMPIYATKTSLSDSNMSNEDFVKAFERGGVALQEVTASMLVEEGQMIRRERTYEGIEVNYVTLSERTAEHRAIADNITSIIREIIFFQETHIDGIIERENKVLAAEQGQAAKTKGTSKAGVDNTPYFSKVFNVINQMLFSIKSPDVADHAIKRLKEGKKVVIAFSNTMGAFLDDVETGEVIKADFSEVLNRGLRSTLRYTEYDAEGKPTHKYFAVSQLSSAGQMAYRAIEQKIATISTGITISPIDVLIDKITEAGFTVAEVTGRDKELRFSYSQEQVEKAKPKKSKEKSGKLENENQIPAIVREIMHPHQVEALVGSGTEEHWGIFEELKADAEKVAARKLETERKAWEKENKGKVVDYYNNIALPSLHYFNSSSDWYIFEWDRPGRMFFGYTILNGDTQNSEWGSISQDELMGNYGFGRNVELDFFYTPEPINKVLIEKGAYVDMDGLSGAGITAKDIVPARIFFKKAGATIDAPDRISILPRPAKEDGYVWVFDLVTANSREKTEEMEELQQAPGFDYEEYSKQFHVKMNVETIVEFYELPPEMVKIDRLPANILSALVQPRKKENANDAFRRFQNNEVDVLLINQSGSTGASAHAVTTKKVSRENVKQRCMIILQAELDINREVQKRGRTNRTGQIIKPIYDYLNSTIPAEQRLMMMLQKKLKSLDANTSSNQKQSSALLDVPDFLNKYGDKIVYDYLVDNPLINAIIGDPLGIKEGQSEAEKPKAEQLQNAAHKVSGRVAILSVKDQENFYTSISEQYEKYINVLKQQGNYDLEMENLNLEAETKKSDVVIVNASTGKSVFANHTYLETCECNNLRKPYQQSEVEALVKQALEGHEDGREYQRKIADDCEKFFTQREAAMIKETDEYYQKKIADIPTEKGYATAADKNQYLADRTEEFQKAHKERENINTERLNYQREFLLGAFRFFYPGRSLKFPTVTFEGGASYAPAVFIKFDIDYRKENPYAPSNVTLSFAIASGMKRVDLPMSGEFGSKITMCKGESYSIKENYVEQWDTLTKKAQANRVTRYIVTGNVLQALAQDTYKGGTLVSYTVKGGGIKKGYLLPDSWQPNFNRENLKQETTKIPVPVFLARKFIRKYATNHAPVLTDTPLTFSRDYDGEFLLVVPMSKTQGGKFYQDLTLVKMTEGENFNKKGTLMVGVVTNNMIDTVMEYLQNELKVNAMLTQEEFMEIKDEIPQSRTQEARPEKTLEPETNLLELELELEAEAALILLQLN